MTFPTPADFTFQGPSAPTVGVADLLGGEAAVSPRAELPPAIYAMSQEAEEQLAIWLDRWIDDLENAQQEKHTQWAQLEELYRAATPAALEFEPFKGACRDVVPAAAMAVDPIHARLDTGIFRQDPVFNLKPLRREYADLVGAVSKFVEAYFRVYMPLRAVASPRILEFVKLGTMVFKTVFDREEHRVLKYDESYTNIEEGSEIRFVGPRVVGVSLGDALFPPYYQHVQDCPVFFERQRTTFEKLKQLEAQRKLANVDKLRGQESVGKRTPLEEARERATKHSLRSTFTNELIVYEGWCDYDVDGDGTVERVIVTYHRDTRTFLQRRLNWYFHQRKAYTIAPYMVTNDSLYGLGVCEMAKQFQDALTRWQRMASDNAYLSNIRMFIAKKNSGIEQVPRLYTGRTFFVDDPTKDFIPFACSDIYPSTLAERQNLFGLLEKRTGVSDYLVGRESPIIGTRATATSTLALIQEGTRRVEEVLENVRRAFAEIVQNCFSIWIQYGTAGIEDRMFGEGDETALKVKQFFRSVNQENVNGMFAVELTATDASTNRQAQQQMQLALIQIFMQYLEKVLQAGASALQAAQMGLAGYPEMVKDVMQAARAMFRDLATKYQVPDPELYLPDLARYVDGALAALGAAGGAGVGAGGAGVAGGPEGERGLPAGSSTYRGPNPTRPSAPGGGVGAGVLEALAGANSGTT